jgi:amino acid adenylation domain-containing protein
MLPLGMMNRPDLDQLTLLVLAPEIRLPVLLAWLREQVASCARVAPEAIAADEPLTQIGLDSLAAAELQGTLESHLGTTITLAELLEGLDLTGLGRVVLERMRPAAPSPITDRRGGQDVPGAGDEGNRFADERMQDTPQDTPLSYGQRSLWVVHRLAPASGAYHIVAVAKVTPALDCGALSGALRALVQRHAVLRTTFHEVAGEPRQRVHASLAPELREIDASTLSEADLTQRLRDEADRPFDLEAGPLLRLGVLRRSPGEDRLLLVVHHIAADFWTLAILTRELAALYEAERAGRPAALPLPGTSYAEYTLWQQARISGPEGERLWQFWRERLAGPLPALNLPVDRPRPPVRGYTGSSVSVRLVPELSRRIAALARANHATLFTALLTSFAALLHRYTGDEDLLLGSPTAGRRRPDLAETAGYFVNPVVLRTDLSGAPGFAELLGRVRETVLAALEHQELPFTLLAERLRPQRDASRSPIFQVMFLLQAARRPEERSLTAFGLGETGARLDFGGHVLESVRWRERGSQFDLTLRMGEVGGALAASLRYDGELFDAVTAQRLLGHLEILLAAVVDDPGRSILHLPLLAAAERQQLLEWNDTAAPGAAPGCLHDLFELQAARTPEALAVVAGGERLTYRQLSAKANRLAHLLRGHGVRRESIVGVCLPRSASMIVAVLGVLKAGGAYLPLDPASPKLRLQTILDETQATVLVTLSSLRDSLPEGCCVPLCLDALSEEIAAAESALPEAVASPGSLAYVLYTSGSTGRPKGVMIEHHSVVNLAGALRATIYRGCDGPLRVAVNAPLAFDASVKQWIQLLDGHALCIVPEEARPDARSMLQFLRGEGVEVLDCTPAQLTYLLEAGLLREPAALARVLVGGEEPSRASWGTLAASQRPVFYNVYGPTECSVDATLAAMRSSPRLPVLGRPIANARVHLLDAAFNPVPVGVPGEICIGGEGVGRGYLRRAAETAERFVPDPWPRVPGERIYRSGDLARRLPDGTLEFLRRVDGQVKVRGFRVELGEIEAVLGESPAVLEAAVAARELEPGERRLVAYVVARGALTPDASELRVVVRRKLPEHMVPSAFMIVESLPRTRNGKIDRSALPAPAISYGPPDEAVLPRNPVEEVLAGMMAEVLGLERVGICDDFFELGGHSLRAAELVAMIRDSFGVEIPLFHLFDTPNVAGIAAVLEENPEWRRRAEEIAPLLLHLAREPVESGRTEE